MRGLFYETGHPGRLSASTLLRAANLEERNLSQEAARLLALELYRED
jgi:hypothetical protein